MNSPTQTGFSMRSSMQGGRLIRQDGNYNVRIEGISRKQYVRIYEELLKLSWFKFFVVMLGFYILVSLVFTIIYLYFGIDHLVRGTH